MSEKTTERNLHKVREYDIQAVEEGDAYSKACYGEARCMAMAEHPGIVVDGRLMRAEVFATLLSQLGWKVKAPK